MDDKELNRLFDMEGEDREGASDEAPSKKRGFFQRLRDKKAQKKTSKGILDDVLDFGSDDEEDVAEEQAPEEVTAPSEEPAKEPAGSGDAPTEDNESSESGSSEEGTEEGPSEGSDQEDDADASEPDLGSSEDEEEEKEEPLEEGEVLEEEEAEEPEPEHKAASSHKPKYRIKTPDIDIPMPSRKVILAAILTGLIIAIILCVAFLPAFRVKYMKIDGNVVVSKQEILEATKLKYNAHLLAGISGNILDVLKLNYGKTEERIKKENPYIRDIDISISLPSTVSIKVEERAKISYVKTVDGYAALDREGTVLELSSDPGDVRPVISGLVVDSAVLGDKCIIENVPDYQRAIIVLGAILQVDNASVENEYSMFANTSEIRILPSGYMFLTIYTPLGSLLQVKLNSTESITDDMTWLRYALVSGGFENLPDGALDMTGDEYIYRPY